MASLFAILIGILFSFSLQGKFVFFNENKWLIWKFLLSWVIIYILQISYINFAINEFGYNAYIIGLTSLPISVSMSYLLQKFFVFRG
jgi:putative flippase GtrA